MAPTQRDLQQRIQSACLATREHIVSMVGAIDAGQLHEHPEPGGWSVAEVLEHLCITAELYERPLRQVIATGTRDAAVGARPWKPTFLGKLVAGMLEKPRKMKAPKKFRPGPTPRNAVLGAYVSGDQTTLDLMDQASSLNWNGERVGSPALPAFMPKFNLGDVFNMHAVHSARHAKQIERLVRRMNPTRS